MIKINKKVEYALMSLKYIASKKDEEHLISAREICEKFGAPFDTTAKVLQIMNSKGIVKSVKGIKGGYALSTDLDTVTYMDLVRLIEGKDQSHFCQNSKGICDLYSSCNIVTPLEQLNSRVNDFLEDLKLSELLFGENYSENKKIENNTSSPMEEL
tara:strand:- start:152861 stop:153328 length:468 start_codon:yes stop_codon:yes gene_type:complete